MPDSLSRTVCPGDLYAIDFVGRMTNYPHDRTRKAIVAIQQIIAVKRIEAASCTRSDETLK
jgi:hypothetical protein